MNQIEEITILIPSHGLEDFPTELDENQAASLLNAFCLAWHPLILQNCERIPRWQAAHDSAGTDRQRVFFLPEPSKEWLPEGWLHDAKKSDCSIFDDLADRQKTEERIAELFGEGIELSQDVLQDFFAFGHCYLQIELLNRRMYQYTEIDEVKIQKEMAAATQAVMANDATTARHRLKICFEHLLEVRERFYPVECYLIDLCLMISSIVTEETAGLLQQQYATNLLVSGKELRELQKSHPKIVEILSEKIGKGELEIVGGEHSEKETSLLSLHSILWELENGFRDYREVLGTTPKVWGRRRFGFHAQLPQLLCKQGIDGAIFFPLDDGVFPDVEQSKLRWEGCDGTVIDALGPIPLAADRSNSFLEFSERMAESMEQDHVATVVFAHWPRIETPWFEDFLRIARFAPVLGRFEMLPRYLNETDDPGRLSCYEAKEFFSPTLSRTVAAEEKDPISRFADYYFSRYRLDSIKKYRGFHRLLGGSKTSTENEATERLLETDGLNSSSEIRGNISRQIDGELESISRLLSERLCDPKIEQPGLLVLNSLSFSRRSLVEVPAEYGVESSQEKTLEIHRDENETTVAVTVPSCGFCWIPLIANQETETTLSKESSSLVVDGQTLRNEYFEVHVNESTGGVGHIKEYGRRYNRLSQQLAFRFSEEKTVPPVEENAPPTRTFYSRMVCENLEVTKNGPLIGELTTTGKIVDPVDDSVIATFQQKICLRRKSRLLELTMTLKPQVPPSGNPWTTYYASRFAWNNSSCVLTYGAQESAQSVEGKRLESPHFFEIADDEKRTTILSGGIPFHRISGGRYLDSILIPAGETRTEFKMAIAVDEPFPMRAALDFMVPVQKILTKNGINTVNRSGWFFHLDAKNVQLIGIEPWVELVDFPENEHSSSLQIETKRDGLGFVVRLLETEGRNRQVRLRCFRRFKNAYSCNFLGCVMTELPVEEDAVTIDIAAYEIVDLKLDIA